MKSYLLSWLRKAHAGAKLAEFEAARPGAWLVWEAGPWRPPSARSDTLVANADTRLLTSGESLAISLQPRRAGPEVKLGRDASCDLVIDDATLSRVHLVFRHEAGGRWTVRDAGSRNGSRLDGRPLRDAARPLAPGSVLEAGAVRLSFLDPAGLWVRLKER